MAGFNGRATKGGKVSPRRGAGLNANPFSGSLTRMRRKKVRSRNSAAVGFMLLACAGVGSALWFEWKRQQPGPATAPFTNSTRAPTSMATVATNTSTTNAAAAIAQWVAGQTDVAELSNAGTELLERGMVNEALLCLQRAVQLKPDDEDLNFNFAFALARAGAIEPAIQYYQRAIEIFPEYADAHSNLGNLLVQQKKLDAAIEHFAAAIRTEPEHSLAHDGLGRALAQQGRAKEALPHFSTAVRLDPKNANARFNLAMAYAVSGRTNDAVMELQDLLKQRPDFAPAAHALARFKRGGQ